VSPQIPMRSSVGLLLMCWGIGQKPLTQASRPGGRLGEVDYN